MASMTAQVLIGSEHPWHDGINPHEVIYLSENSRAALVLLPASVDGENPAFTKVVWIPHPGYLMESLLLMIALHCEESPKMVQSLQHLIGEIPGDKADLSEQSESVLTVLFQALQAYTFQAKLVLTILAGSSLLRDISRLVQFQVTAEVCISDQVA